MVKISLQTRRRAVQAGAFIVLVLPLFFSNTVWFGTYISANLAGFALTDPFTVLEISAADRQLWWPLLISAAPLLIAAAVLGRVFCSFICPLNFLLEVLPFRKKAKLRWSLSPIIAIPLLTLIAVASQIPVFTIVSPLHTLMRIILFGMGAETIILVFLLVGEWLYGPKAWCRNICPVGALYGLAGVKRCVTISLDTDICTGCKKCVAVCSMGVTPGSNGFMDKVNCTNCGDCMDACSEEALYYSAFRKTNTKREVNSNETMDGIAQQKNYR